MGKEEITQPKMYREERKAQVHILKNINDFKVEKAEQAESMRRGARGHLGESRVSGPPEERLIGSRDLSL